MPNRPEQKIDFGAQTAWFEVDLGKAVESQSFVNNSSSESCEISFDQVDAHLTLAPGQTFTYEHHNTRFLYVRNASLASVPGNEVQIVAWSAY